MKIDQWASEEEVEEDEGYLDEAEHDHGMELWTLARIFESPELEENFDTRYSDVSVMMTNNWKIVKFELDRFDALGQRWRADVDLFAVIR